MTDPSRLAEAVRDACLRAASEAYEDAGIQGLCAEGRWEVALGAVRRLDLAPLLAQRPESAVGAGPAAGESPSEAR